MKIPNLLMLFLVLGCLPGLADHLQAAPRYRYYTTGQGPGSEGVAINDKGQAVVNFHNRAYLWTLKDGLHDLGDLGGGQTTAYAINNLGQIVGESYIDSVNTHAFFWEAGQMTDLGTLFDAGHCQARSINNQGQIVGYCIIGETMTPFIKQPGNIQPGGSIEYLDLQGGIALKIIDDGRMAGIKNGHAWLWTAPGPGQDLGALPASYAIGFVPDMNQNGVVVGWGIPPNPPNDSASRAYSWTVSGGPHDLGTLGGAYSRAFGIDNRGYIVGWADSNSPPYTSGCLWTPSGAKYSLDALVVNKPAGVTIGDARAINVHGVIVGHGNNSGEAYMLVPVAANPALNLLLP